MTMRAPLYLMMAVVVPLLSAHGLRAQGTGDLSVAPTRVVLEGRERAAAITVANRGSQTVNYRVSIVNMNMTDTGEFKEIAEPEPGAPFAEPLIRFAPRSVSLPPGGSQTIRILLRKPEELADGEYRSHLFIRGEPDPSTGRSIEQPNNSNDLRIQLQPIFGVTLPIIVRQGNLTSEAGISDLQILKEDAANPTPRLRFKIQRSGTSSTFGDIRVGFMPAGGKQEIVVGELNSLAVYTPNSERLVEISLRVPDGIKLNGGLLNVRYNRPDSEGNRPIAQATLSLQ